MSPRSEIFLQHLPEESKGSVAQLDVEALERELYGLFERARAACPSVVVDELTFVRYVAERFSPEQTLESTHGDGLYLACACAMGDERAVAAFRDQFQPVMNGVYRRLGFHRVAEEVTQRVMRSIFVYDGQSGPAILRYTGRGSLANWIRVLTVREAYRTTRKERKTSQREVGGVDERLMDRAVSEEANPELIHLKRDYRAKFKASFQQAFERLSHRERNILRYQYLDGLNLEQIGAIHDVSRATVARWRARARSQLLAETRKIMRDEFRVPLDEFDNAMKLIESAMDVSLSRLLHAVAKDDERESASGS